MKFSVLTFKTLQKYRAFAFVLVFTALVVGVTLVEEIEIRPASRVYVFDVGQGDGMLVRSRRGVTVLIDGGPTGKITEHLDRVLPYRDREIDYMVATHPHADHVAGLVSVLEQFPVRNAIITGVVHTTDVYLEFLELLREKRCDTKAVLRRDQDDKEKDCIKIIVANGEKTIADRDVTIELLWPLESFEGKTVNDAGENTEGGLNDTSIVSRVTIEGKTFLFPGDAGVGVEKRIVEAGESVHSDVAILAHHGSKTASSEEWLKAVDPDYAVISAGRKNRYRLPSYITVRRVERLGIPLYRTDQEGTIEFLVEGGRIRVKTER